MPALLEILEQEHADMRRLLDLIKTEADAAETPDFGLLHEIVEYCLAFLDQYHHPKEELIYAALRQLDPVGAGAVDAIAAEHKALAIATRELAPPRGAPPVSISMRMRSRITPTSSPMVNRSR